MEKYQDLLEARQDYLARIIKEKKETLKDAPEGSLRISCHDGKVSYYHKNGPEDANGTYISEREQGLPMLLAQADYNKKIIKLATKELDAIQKFTMRNSDKKIEELYETMHEERKKLVTPIIETDEMFIKRWIEQNYVHKSFPENYPEYYTNRGERVRSKSEIIIADALDKAGIPYHYEYPTNLIGYGKVYSDFLTLNIRTREEIIWEHLGMLDDSNYSENNVNKINYYIKNEIYPGEKLILTYETRNNPLNQKIVKQMIEHYLK